METRLYYAIRYRLDHKDHWLIWHSNDPTEGDEADGVVINKAGKMLVFRTDQDLLAYAKSEGLSPTDAEEPSYYNLDAVVRWLRRKRPTQIDSNKFLDVWNLFAAISTSVGGSFDTRKEQTSSVLNKLFWGCNLPAVTPVGSYYKPVWRNRENKLIRQVMRDGLSLFRSRALLTKPQSA